MTNRVRLSISSGFANTSLIEVTVSQFAQLRGATPDQCTLLASNARHMADWINRNAYSQSDPGEIVVELESIAGGVCCTIEDWGSPINSFDSRLDNIPDDLIEVARTSQGLRLLNLGYKGKRLCAIFPIEGLAPYPAPPENYDLETDTDSHSSNNSVEIRASQLEDAEGIASLIYSQYKLTYVHEDFYNPSWICEQIKNGHLISTVAILKGEVVGHYSLSDTHPRTAFESGVAIVDPRCRNAGLIKKMAIATIDRARQIGLKAIVARAVMHHPYSQRAAHTLGFRVSGLLVGALPVGFGGAEKRNSLLLAYLQLVKTPHAVSLPDRYRTLLVAAYENIDIEMLAYDTAKGLREIDSELAVQVEMHEPGEQIITIGQWNDQTRGDLIAALRNAVYQKRDVVYCDLDLHSLSSAKLDEIVNLVRTYDFFYAGLLAFGRAGHSHLRMQAVLTPIDSIEIKGLVFDSDLVRSLHRCVIEDHDQLIKLL